MVRAIVLVAVAIAMIAARPALARADGDARLAVSGDACAEAPLRARIAVLLGRDPFTADATAGERAIAVELARTGGAIVATIDVDARRRELRAASCAELTEAVALAIALVLEQPRADAEETSARPTSTPPPAPADIVAAPPPTFPRRRVLAVYAGLAGGRASGDVAARAIAGAEVRRGRASLGLSFELGAADTIAVAPGRVVIATRVLDVAGCWRRGSVSACATAALGWVHGRGEDLDAATAGTTPYAAPGARLGWERALSARVGVRLGVAVRVPVTRNRFLVDGMPVWSTSAVEGWLAIGLAARIP